MPDPSQQPITAADPRVAQVLALIRAQTGQVPVEPTATPSTGLIAPPASAQLQPPVSPAPPAPRFNELGAPLQPMNEPGSALPAPPDAPPTAPTPGPGPVKSFLMSLGTHLLGGVQSGQAALLHQAGLPTPYEKQQNALKMGLQQQQQTSLEGLRQSQQDLYGGKLDQLQSQLTPTQIPNDPKYGPFAGQTLPLSAAQSITKTYDTLANQKGISADKNTTTLAGKEIQYGPDSFLRKGVRSIGGRIELYDKSNGNLLKDMGPDTALATARERGIGYAYGRAMYTPFQTVDANGAPTVISNLQAIHSGAPQMGFSATRNFVSDMVGVKQYQDILDQKISPNLAVLNDPTQRAIIAHTLSEGKDASPGAIQALITSGLQDGALSSQGAALTAGILQAREFGSVARKYGGNMNGTEGLMDRIMSNQASPLNAEQLNRDLVQNDRTFTDRAMKTITNLTSNAARTPVRGTPAAPGTPAPAAGGNWAAQFGGVPAPK